MRGRKGRKGKRRGHEREEKGAVTRRRTTRVQSTPTTTTRKQRCEKLFPKSHAPSSSNKKRSGLVLLATEPGATAGCTR